MRFSKKYLDLLTLILLCWFSDIFQFFSSYVLTEISLYLERNLLFPELTAMSLQKEVVLLVLLNFSKYQKTREIFGTVLEPDRVERVIRQTSLRMIRPRCPKRNIRHRGYRDHGTLRPSDKWIEHFDFSFTEKQLLYEEKKEEYFDTVSTIIHKAGDWVLKHQKGERNYESQS